MYSPEIENGRAKLKNGGKEKNYCAFGLVKKSRAFFIKCMMMR